MLLYRRPSEWSGKLLVLLLHSNGSDAGQQEALVRPLLLSKAVGYVLCCEYPGYGEFRSAPTTISGVDSAAAAALQYAVRMLRVPPRNVVLLGQSIGTGVAARLARQMQAVGTPCRSLVLLAPYTSTAALGADRMGGSMLLARALMPLDGWQPERDLRFLTSRVLLVHGGEDSVIPSRHAVALYGQMERAKQKDILVVAGAEHMEVRPETWEHIHAFLES
jgi:uncharacterized protein